jgi:hypothetical protein
MKQSELESITTNFLAREADTGTFGREKVWKSNMNKTFKGVWKVWEMFLLSMFDDPCRSYTHI